MAEVNKLWSVIVRLSGLISNADVFAFQTYVAEFTFKCNIITKSKLIKQLSNFRR